MLGMVLLLSCAWTESFETQDFFPPDHWLIVNEDCLDAFWFRDMSTGYSGTNSATCYADTDYTELNFTNLDYLITPQILPDNAGNDTLMSFYYKSSVSGCSLDILITNSSPPEMSTWNLLQIFVSMDTSWAVHSVDLSSYSGVPSHIAFRIRNIHDDAQVWLDDIMLPDMNVQPNEYNGRLRTKGLPSQKYVLVWGSHYEMGHALGYLLGEEAIANLERFAIGNSSLHMITPVLYEYGALPYFRLRFATLQKYQDEAQGMIDGCLAKGVDLYHQALGRDITAEDILCLNSLCDFGCSSISGWGESTINDDTLEGGLVIARDLDYSSGQYTSLGNTSVIIAFAPESPNEQNFVLITMAGIFGCLSGVNEHGVGLCCDYGYHSDTTYIPPNSLTAFILSCRNALETADFDSNGVNDIYDLKAAIHDSASLRCWDVHLFSPYDANHPIPTGILEINNIGDSLRLTSDNVIAPQINSDWNLCVTNHERVLYPPVYCSRYQAVADSLNDDLHLDTRRAISIENAVAGWGYYAGTVQSMAIRANVITTHPDWPCIAVSYARRNQGAHVFNHLYYSWEELFDGLPGIEEQGDVPLKSTFFRPTVFSGPLSLPDHVDYKIFNTAGREVSVNSLVPGIYFIKQGNKDAVKVIKIK